MKSLRSALSVLLLLTITTVAESTRSLMKVKLRDSAVLPCSKNCSGVVKWTLFSKSTDTLAECDQTSCRSVKEGYQMIHDQYLKGDLSLTITEADFSKKSLYICNCDGTDLCDVELLIEPLKSEVQMNVGESLLLELDISDPVEVVYSSTDAAGPSNVQICRVERHSVEFKHEEYADRLTLSSSSFELRGMKVSDSGVYTVRDTLNDEAIHIYTVSVYDDQPDLDRDKGVPVWVVVLLVVLLVGVTVVFVGVILCLWRRNQQLQTRMECSSPHY